MSEDDLTAYQNLDFKKLDYLYSSPKQYQIVGGEGLLAQINKYLSNDKTEENSQLEQLNLQLEMLLEDLEGEMPIETKSALKSRIRSIRKEIKQLEKKLK